MGIPQELSEFKKGKFEWWFRGLSSGYTGITFPAGTLCNILRVFRIGRMLTLNANIQPVRSTVWVTHPNKDSGYIPLDSPLVPSICTSSTMSSTLILSCYQINTAGLWEAELYRLLKNESWWKWGDLWNISCLPSRNTHSPKAVIMRAQSQLYHNIFLWKPEV